MTITIEGSYKTTKTTITIETITIYTSRLIGNRLYKLNVNINGSVQDLLTKIERVSKLDDENYIEFDRIRQEVNSD